MKPHTLTQLQLDYSAVSDEGLHVQALGSSRYQMESSLLITDLLCPFTWVHIMRVPRLMGHMGQLGSQKLVLCLSFDLTRPDVGAA